MCVCMCVCTCVYLNDHIVLYTFLPPHSVAETLPTLQCDVDPLKLQKYEQLKWNISPESEADIERAKVNVSKWVTMAVA